MDNNKYDENFITVFKYTMYKQTPKKIIRGKQMMLAKLSETDPIYEAKNKCPSPLHGISF